MHDSDTQNVEDELPVTTDVEELAGLDWFRPAWLEEPINNNICNIECSHHNVLECMCFKTTLKFFIYIIEVCKEQFYFCFQVVYLYILFADFWESAPFYHCP
jgi:hypothetical protein